MVFLIQNTQNRDMMAIQLKLDELIWGITGIDTALVDIEELSDKELEKLKLYFAEISGGAEAVERKVNKESEKEKK